LFMYYLKKQRKFSVRHNKAFKSDSQRLAFSVQGWVSCLRCKGLGLGGSVAHTLMRRYISF
jgi:hypothetical protein